jgi:hypothetical protein
VGQGHFGIEYQRVMKWCILGILEVFCGVLCGFWGKILIGESFLGDKGIVVESLTPKNPFPYTVIYDPLDLLLSPQKAYKTVY